MAPSHQPLERVKSLPSEVSLVVKYVLFGLNVLFWIIGGLMIGIGIYAKTEKSYGGLGKSLPWFMDPANIFIIIGAVVFTLAFLGCVGSLRENVAILRTFEYTIDILLLLEVVLVIYIYFDRDRVKRKVEDVLAETIPNYRGEDSDFQAIIDWIQENMECCGVKGPDDWDGNVYFNCSFTKSPESCGVPHSCCRNAEEEINSQCGYKVRSDRKNEQNILIYTDGCVDAVIRKLLSEDNLILIVIVAGAMVLLQLVTTGLAHHLVQGIRRQMSRWNDTYRGRSNDAYYN